MMPGVIITVSLAQLAAHPLANSSHANPTLVILALGILLLIGTRLIAGGFGAHMRYLACTLIVASQFYAGALADSPKQLIGAIETIAVEPAGIDLRARVDTGAQTTSIHAENIEIDKAGDARGKSIAFRLVNLQGQSQRVETHVARQILVKTSEGSERRYAVPLTLRWRQHSKTVLVTLNDRSGMRHRLLLGRNWLRGDFIVDVELNDED